MKELGNLPPTTASPASKAIALFKEIQHLKKRKFLAAFCQCGRVRKASDEAGIHFTSHYIWLRNDKVYAEAFEASKQIAADHFEDEIYRRGFEGYDKPVTYQGEIKDHYKDYSDVLAIFALKGLRPEKYRENSPFASLACPVSIAISYPAPPEKVINSASEEKTED